VRNFNVALKLCTGDLIAFLDGDDLYFPGKLSAQVDYLRQHPACAACYHDVAVFSQDPASPHYYWSERFETRSGAVKDVARYGHFPSVVSLMLRREHLPAGGYNQSLATQADWLLLMETLHNSGGAIEYLDVVFAAYRVHADSVSSDWAGKVGSRYQTIQIAKEIYPHLGRRLDAYAADLKFLDGLNCLQKWKLLEGLRYILQAAAMAFPNVFSVLRIPLREIAFRAKRVFR
jgi:glycosyltransferase involved in cell wall biosynthesis